MICYFTGSTEAGRKIVQASAGNLKKVMLELGGKSLNIIFPDADLKYAVRGAMNAIFFNSGQVCTAGSRLFVHASVYGDLGQHLQPVRRSRAFRRLQTKLLRSRNGTRRA